MDYFVTGLSQNAPSSHNLVCMEETSLVVGNEQNKRLRDNLSSSPTLNINQSRYRKSFAEQQQLMTSYVTDRPEQSYLTLLKSRPDLFQSIP